MKITVKCPAILTPETADYSLQVTEGLGTVKDLKEALVKEHPCHPDVLDQRLIFRGRLLEDSQSLEQLLNFDVSSETVVVHMVLKSGRYGRPSRLESPVIPFRISTTKLGDAEAVSPVASTQSIPTLPLLPTSASNATSASTMCAIVNDRGQSIPTDLSQALFFDGRRFYTMRGATLPMVNSTNPIPPTQITARAAERPRFRRVFRIHFDLMTVFSFLMKLGVILLLFAKNSSTTKLVLIGVVFTLIHVVQAGFLPTPFSFDQVRTRWRRVLEQRIRRDDHAAAAHGEEGEVYAHILHPVITAFEVFLTFVASLFPAGLPPRPMVGVAPAADEPQNARLGEGMVAA